HDDWLRQIEQELDGELSLPERAALARHLAGCRHCAETRVSHLEMRVAFARSAGQPHAHTVPRPAIRGRTLGLWMAISLIAGAAELQGLLGTLPEPDTVNLAGMFFSRRPAGRSRRGLPLFEEDSYRRWARVVWGGTTRLYPFGAEWAGQRRALWVEITVDREF